MNHKLQNLFNIIQQLEKLDAEQKENLLKALKDADKELEITAFKLERTERVKKTTAILLEETIEELEQKRIAVEEQNRELEIAASLERVRAVAMGMDKSEDLLNICEISFKEFQNLGFDNLRNAVIHIPNDEQKYFMDYDYSEFTGGAIAKIEYGSHPIVDEYLDKIRSAEDAYFEVVIDKGQLEGWKEFRINSGQSDDTRLDEADAIYYYLFSIGIGDIGISAFKPINDYQKMILKRFRNVFDLAYRRYNDIKLAEAQAREAEIQLALERVRAKAMAMHSSEDLTKTADTFFSELLNLNITPHRCGFGIVDKETKVADIHATTATQDKSFKIVTGQLKLYGHPILDKVFEGFQKQEEYHPILQGKEISDYYAVMNPQVEFPDFSDDEMQYGYYFYFKEGGVFAWFDKEISKDDLEIFRRYTAVLSLTYRRYIELREAETQAREAQIEASLERVRAMAMAMHNSEDLSSTVGIFFKELKALDIIPIRCGVGQIDEATRTTYLTTTTSSQIGKSFDVIGKVKQTGHPVLDGIFENWKLQKEYHPILKGEDIKAYYGIMNRQIKYPEYREDITQYGNMFYFKEGFIFAWTENRLSEEELQIFRRFSSVLSLTYRRFMDLKEAESQAKEAKIEAALEKVRARTMGMQKSDELKEVIQVIYDQFVQLNINVEHTGFIIDYKIRDDMLIWLADKNGAPSRISIPYFDSPHWNSFIEAKTNNRAHFANHLNFEEKNRFYEKLFKFIPDLPDDARDFYFKCPGLAISTVLLDNVGLYIENFSGNPYSDEENAILMRFGKVFQQTYTRFLDLQKAESQAREAQIEAALESVRSSSLAMQKSDELIKVVKVVFKKFQELDFAIDGAALIATMSDKEKIMDIWIADDHAEYLSCIKLPYYDTPTITDIWTAKESGAEFTSKTYSFKEKNNWFKYAFSNTDFSSALPDQLKSWILEQEYLTQTFAFGKLSAIGIHFHYKKVLSENEIDILQRFSKVFEQSYIRFLDLKKAEMQAREAQIEAALERVRARSMAMHKSNELAQTAAHLFAQLNELGIKPYRCNIAIVETDSTACQLWSTTNSGNVIPTSTSIPLDENPIFIEMNEGWKVKRNDHIIRLQGEERLTWTKYISRYVKFKEYKPEYIDEQKILKEPAIFSNLYFKQGFFVIHTLEELSQADLNIIQRFANVFEQTYTRFLDLERAEAQKKLIEAENERKTQELEEARQLQLAMLPKDIPQLPNLEIAVYMKTASEVGGDYYDFHVSEDGTLSVVLGDATGHGMKAGTMVTITKSLFNTLAPSRDIVKTFKRISQVIKDMKFRQLSMCLQMLKIKENELIFSSAAMPPLFLYSDRKRNVEELLLSGMPLGAMINYQYKIEKRSLGKGDIIFMLSDGLPELLNGKRKMYGYERIKEQLKLTGRKSPKEIIAHFEGSAIEWLEGSEADDDITFVVLKVI